METPRIIADVIDAAPLVIENSADDAAERRRKSAASGEHFSDSSKCLAYRFHMVERHGIEPWKAPDDLSRTTGEWGSPATDHRCSPLAAGIQTANLCSLAYASGHA